MMMSSGIMFLAILVGCKQTSDIESICQQWDYIYVPDKFIQQRKYRDFITQIDVNNQARMNLCFNDYGMGF